MFFSKCKTEHCTGLIILSAAPQSTTREKVYISFFFKFQPKALLPFQLFCVWFYPEIISDININTYSIYYVKGYLYQKANVIFNTKMARGPSRSYSTPATTTVINCNLGHPFLFEKTKPKKDRDCFPNFFVWRLDEFNSILSSSSPMVCWLLMGRLCNSAFYSRHGIDHISDICQLTLWTRCTLNRICIQGTSFLLAVDKGGVTDRQFSYRELANCCIQDPKWSITLLRNRQQNFKLFFWTSYRQELFLQRKFENLNFLFP